MDVPQLVYPFTSWTLGLLPVSAIRNKAAIDVLVQVFVWTYVFIFFSKYLGMELLGHRVDTHLTL